MTIEPIGSAMTYQAQTTVRPQTSTASAGNEDFTAKTSDVSAQNVDTMTSQVAKVETNSEDQSNAGNNGGGQQPSMDQLKKAIENINKNSANSDVQYGFHDETNRVTIKIVDKETKKVIKELPPEKTLDMIAKAWELAGILIDEKR